MRCSHDGSQPQPASMYAQRRRGKRSNTPCTIIDSSAYCASCGCTTVCHSVNVSKRSDPGGGRVEAHVLVGGERAVEILQQLVDRVVVAVAEVAVVELVGPGPEAADAEVVVRVLDLLDRACHVVERDRARRDHARRFGASRASPGPSGCTRAPSRPGARGRCPRATCRTRGRRSPSRRRPRRRAPSATRSPVKPSVIDRRRTWRPCRRSVQLIAFWNWP